MKISIFTGEKISLYIAWACFRNEPFQEVRGQKKYHLRSVSRVTEAAKISTRNRMWLGQCTADVERSICQIQFHDL